MNKMLFLGLTAALLAAGVAAQAYPIFTGLTGNVVLPTAATAPSGDTTIAADYIDLRNIDSRESKNSSIALRAIGAVDANWEFGGGYNFVKIAGQNANTYFLDTKVKMLGDDCSACSLYATYGSTHRYGDIPHNISTMQGGIAADEQVSLLGCTITSTLGANWTRQDFTTLKPNAVRYFAGMDIELIEHFHMVGDYQTKATKLEQHALYGVALRYVKSNSFDIQVGYSNVSPVGFVNGAKEGRFFAGIGFSFNEDSSDW